MTRSLLTAAEMRELDARAVGLGIPAAVLMERAGMAAAAEIRAAHPDARAAVVLCGGGNNGGDGYVVARELHEAGLDVRVLAVVPPDRLTGEARRNADVAAALGIAVARPGAPAALRGQLARAGVVVDALIGTGFTGAPRAPAQAAIAAANRARAPIVALDVPSGVDASTGRVEGQAVEAESTVAFHAAKVGLHVAPGRFHAGRVRVVDIGIPRSLEAPAAVALAGPELLCAVPAKDARTNKYSAGSVLVVGGAPGFAGAPLMTSLAAMRAGAGLVWTAVPAALVGAVEGREPELIVRPFAELDELLGRASALAVGPGLGRGEEAMSLVRRLAGARAPLVLDADGLFAFAGEPEALARRRAPTVLTPHAGEMARLLGVESAWVAANRLEAVRTAARRAGSAVLLKGADTLVAAPGGEQVLVCPADVPGLATAGSGDVLTGAVAAVLAKGVEAPAAAAAAALAHARAGAVAAESYGPAGIMARDLIDALPRGFAAP